MTPSEFIELYDGWKWRENRRGEEIKSLHELEMVRYSVLASWLTAPHLKKPKKPTDFYDPNQSKDKKKTSPEQSKKIMLELEKEMGVKDEWLKP